MAKKRGLAANRGLDALLGSIKKEKQIAASALRDESVSKEVADSNKEHTHANTTSTSSHRANTKKTATANKSTSSVSRSSTDEQMSLVQIAVEQLQAGKYQPRRDMSETALAELADSIRQHGVMQPIVIRPLLANEDKTAEQVTHEIIAGERRWRAAKMAGETVIPAIERALSDELAIALALIENIQREDLSVIEQAAALQRFHTEFGMSHAMIAEVVGKARTTVSNLLRLNQLHEQVKEHLADKHLDMGHARTLLSLSLEQQPIIAQKIIDQQMTVREAEKLVKSILQPSSASIKSSQADDHEKQAVERRLSEILGAEVKLKQKKNGKGSVEIFFHSDDELEQLQKLLSVSYSC
ncbi:ParB/RepB/Spo0J family partition protein [Psychrobacter sp. I-STPA10]|uniref:ParB/RepB/Spo0J family partition protein n=1 Tax=Psychrobacter sp. I-STPA10 TaxID=2585769 RepID=UPI001E559896|nr:ParB/RepB/Spo0J family partition protein [Psychrobacter sp. I-STPA10]